MSESAMSDVVYASSRQGRIAALPRELIRHRELLWNLVSKDLRKRYRFAAIGFLWMVIEPLAMTALLTAVFTIILPLRFGGAAGASPFEHAVMLLCAYVFWRFLSESLTWGVRSHIAHGPLIKKVAFPREVVPLAAVGFCFANLLIGIALLCIVHLLFGGAIGLNAAWVLPALAIQTALAAGLVLVASSANVVFRDVMPITDILVVFGFYATPIFYALEDVTGSAFAEAHPWLPIVYQLNPMAGLVTAYRHSLLLNEVPAFWHLAWPAAAAACVLAAGIWTARRLGGTLADHL